MTVNPEFENVLKRLEYFDQERRSTAHKLAEMERQIEQYQLDIERRDRRIVQLENKLAAVTSDQSVEVEMDSRFRKLRSELLKRVDKATVERAESTRDMDRLRLAEVQGISRDVADMQKQMPDIARVQQEVFRRRDEETRLLQIINQMQDRFGKVDERLDESMSGSAYQDQSVKRITTQIQQIEGKMAALGHDQTQVIGRVENAISAANRNENRLEKVQDHYRDMTNSLQDWIDKIGMAEFDRNQRSEARQAVFEAYTEDLARFQQQWGIIQDQHREARITLGNIERWQSEIDTKIKESGEIGRMNNQQYQQRWEEFLIEFERAKQTSTISIDQHTDKFDRRQREMEDIVFAMEESVRELRRDINTLYRVHSYHADSMKRLAAFWLTDVQKAVENDPERRRSPTPTPLPDEV